ncbi:hypothetical protein [Microscilla marina]|uniref:Uncharacterized protein n=1 Tax=Microscilla marina ATCC 23134 TaxID=313606 RepID=A1ZWG1_MICM2|nr:hypothetical protein [Microscilla marina]EAY25301.1 hypothetical protein M23134_02771 [Microscilla marina ATCC 23134]
MNRKQQNDYEQLASILENIRSMDEEKPKKEVQAPPIKSTSKHKGHKSA